MRLPNRQTKVKYVSVEEVESRIKAQKIKDENLGFGL